MPILLLLPLPPKRAPVSRPASSVAGPCCSSCAAMAALLAFGKGREHS